MIKVIDLHKSFGSHHVLKGINLEVARGSVVCIIGPSGSGKSTLLRCMNLLERPEEGHVLIDGVDITDPKQDINELRTEAGMVFQRFNLFPHMTVLNNITLAPMQVRKVSREAAEAEAYSASIKIVELARSLGYEVTETAGEDGSVSFDIAGNDDAGKQLILEYLQYLEYLAKWNGELPDVVGDGTGIMITVPSSPEAGQP